MSYRNVLILFFLLGVMSMCNGQDRLVIGDTIYSYSYEGWDGVSSLNHNEIRAAIPCVESKVVTEPEIPHTNYKLVSDSGMDMILGEDKDLLVIKGEEGIDPFFGIAEKYIQYIGGVPICNLSSISDIDREDTARGYVEYKTTELPEAIQIWCELMSYEKLRLKFEISYKTAYMGPSSDDPLDDFPYSVKTEYNIEVKELSVKQQDWSLIDLDSHPDFSKYLADKYFQYERYFYANSILNSTTIYTSPVARVEYLMDKVWLPVPECNNHKESFYVFPNPSFGNLNIDLRDMSASAYDFDLYDIIGNHLWYAEVKQPENSNRIVPLELPSLKKGIYLYSIKDKAGRMLQSQRLVIIEY